MPDMPNTMKNQRFVFMGGLFGSILAMRERALVNGGSPNSTWRSAQTLPHLALVMAALLEAPAEEIPQGDTENPLPLNENDVSPSTLGFIE